MTETIRTPAVAGDNPLVETTGAAADSTMRRRAVHAAAGDLSSSPLYCEQTLQHLARLAVPALFFVRLPLAGGGGPPPEPLPEETDRGGGRAARRVLVVDDNVDAADMLAELLKLDGHDVRTATSGPAALETVADFAPHVALLDIGLPGMNGYDLARRLREQPHLAGITLVAVTGWGQGEDRQQSKEAGFDHHLTKPVDPDDVRRLVADAAGR